MTRWSRHPRGRPRIVHGSTAAGRRIAEAAGGAPKRLVLELGGNAPVIVYDDIDLEAALPILTNGVLFNAGQECMSATRMLVSEKIHDRFVEAMAETVGGHDRRRRRPATVLGPLISGRNSIASSAWSTADPNVHR